MYLFSQFYGLLHRLEASVHSAPLLRHLGRHTLLHTLSERKEGEAGHVLGPGKWLYHYQFTLCTFWKEFLLASTELLHGPGTVLSSLHIVP